MKLEITPEPSVRERAAIEAALRQEAEEDQELERARGVSRALFLRDDPEKWGEAVSIRPARAFTAHVRRVHPLL
jgi:hypothetical protein